MTERYVDAGPLRLWTERTGDPDHPAVLLVAGAAAQGYTSPDALVDRLVGHGLQVIRYDHRDTGLSGVVDFDRHPYGLADLAADAVAVLDGYDLPAAHIAGMSMGGMVAQWLGVHQPGRVRSLSLLSSSPMSGPDGLPPSSPRLRRHFAGTADVPRGVAADVELFRLFNGDVRPFDEAGARAVLERCWARAIDPSAATHHFRVASVGGPGPLGPLSAVTAPTTVIHGDQDPVFPPGHGEALAAAIPGARLEIVPGMGHVYFSPGLPEELADLIAAAV